MLRHVYIYMLFDILQYSRINICIQDDFTHRLPPPPNFITNKIVLPQLLYWLIVNFVSLWSVGQGLKLYLVHLVYLQCIYYPWLSFLSYKQG